MPFPSQVNTQPAPAVAGDFCDSNPRYTVDAGPGGLVAGPGGVVVGCFAWAVPPLDPDNSPSVVNNFGSGPVTGFVHREENALFTQYLQEASNVIPAGFGMTLFSGGGFWALNSGAGQALYGQKAYANLATGAVTFAATGSPTTGASGSASTIAAATSSFTASIAGDVMTVSVVATGTVYPGTTISGTNVASGTKIASQASGTPGGAGTYLVSIPEQTVASTTISGTYGLLTVGGTVTGTFGVNDPLSGTGVVAGTTITALGTGTGGAGTYVVNNNTAVASAAITVAGVDVETKWVAMSSGAPGELVKISDHVLG